MSKMLQFRVQDELAEQINTWAKAQGMTLSDWLMEAVEAKIDRRRTSLSHQVMGETRARAKELGVDPKVLVEETLLESWAIEPEDRPLGSMPSGEFGHAWRRDCDLPRSKSRNVGWGNICECQRSANPA